MQSVIRKYVILTSVILCATLLVTGIINVNEETSYVISGEKKEVLRVQSTTSERLLISTDDKTQTEIFAVDSEKIKSVTTLLLTGILPSPFSQIIWGLGNQQVENANK